MSNPLFVRQPFASSGDKTPIPQTSGDGSVNWADGFGPDYSRDPATDADAKRVPRPETNQLYSEMTANIRAWQINTAAAWAAPSDNGGSPVNYPRNALVRHNAKTWAALFDGAVLEPGTDAASWVEIDPFSLAALVAVDADYATPASNAKLVTPAGVAKALREGRLSSAPAVNSVGTAYTLTLPGVTFAQGVFAQVEFTVPAASPAGPLTLKVNALATLPLQTSIESTLAAGDLQPGRVYTARSTGSKWLITQSVPSQSSAAPLTLPDRLVAITNTAPAITDLNQVLGTGWYATPAGVANGPSSLSSLPLFVRVETSDGTASTQYATGFAASTEANTQTWARSRISGAWQPWRRVYSSATEIQQVSVPPGCQMEYAGLSAPNGWLVRDGSAVSRVVYIGLFAAIGTLYGAGDGSTTFNIPNDMNPLGDGRGAFTRAGTPNGVTYADSVGPHAHQLPSRSNANSGNGYVEDADSSGTAQTAFTETSGPSIGTETAPLHVRRLPIIKY